VTGWKGARRGRGAAADEISGPRPGLDDLDDGGGLRPIYFVLGITIVVAVVIVVLLPDHDMVDRFGANVATEAAAILVTLIFVHRFLQQQDRARRLRASIGALRRASRGLTRIVDTWTPLLRGTLPRPGMERPRTVFGLFRAELTEGLVYADPAVIHPEAGGQPTTWLGWAARELVAATAMLHDIIVAYGPSLDPVYVEAMDELIDDPFVRLLDELTADETLDARSWRMRINAARAQREAHFERLRRLLELHNALAGQAGRVRAKWSAPKSGVLGFELAPDHDLRVTTRIAAEVWQAEPAPGSLVAADRRDATALQSGGPEG
jgi:hypothetical protein